MRHITSVGILATRRIVTRRNGTTIFIMPRMFSLPTNPMVTTETILANPRHTWGGAWRKVTPFRGRNRHTVEGALGASLVATCPRPASCLFCRTTIKSETALLASGSQAWQIQVRSRRPLRYCSWLRRLQCSLWEKSSAQAHRFSFSANLMQNWLARSAKGVDRNLRDLPNSVPRKHRLGYPTRTARIRSYDRSSIGLA